MMNNLHTRLTSDIDHGVRPCQSAAQRPKAGRFRTQWDPWNVTCIALLAAVAATLPASPTAAHPGAAGPVGQASPASTAHHRATPEQVQFSLFPQIPECNAEETVDVVEEIAREELAAQLGARFWDPEGGAALAEAVTFNVTAIRTLAQLANGGFECAARLEMKTDKGEENAIEILYYIDPVDDSDEFYVTVEGLR